MKYLYTFFIAIIIVCANNAHAQTTSSESFVITHFGEYDQERLTSALENCQLDRYRKMNSRSTLKFDDGTTVSLLSATELAAKGIEVDETILLAEGETNNNLFRLKPNGYIMELISPAPSLNQQKLNEDLKNGGKK